MRNLGSEYIIVAGESRAKALLDLGYLPNYEVAALVGDFDDGTARVDVGAGGLSGA